MRNNINMQESGVLFGMYNLATNGQQFLNNFYVKSKRAVAKGRTEGPAAWLLPADEIRPTEQAALLRLLQVQGVEISRLTKEFTPSTDGRGSTAESSSSKGQQPSSETQAPSTRAPRTGALARDDGKEKPSTANKLPAPAAGATVFPAGSYVIRMDQPYSRLADMALDTQFYSARDPRSYDDTGWTLGALRNLKTVRVTDAAILDAPMEKLQGDVVAAGAVKGAGKTLLINNTGEPALATLRYRLPQAKVEAAEQAFESGGVKFRPGTFIIRDADRGQVEQAAKELGLTLYATDADPKVAAHPLSAPRIALMHSWQSTQNDGWVRIAMDRARIPYTYIADTKVRETSDLRSQFDVIILPPVGGGPGALQSALRGIPKRNDKPLAWKNTAETPNLVAPGLDESDDIRGGLGYSGLTNLDKFVSAGGLLIAMQGMSALPVQGGMTEMVNVNEARQMQASGSVVLATIDDKKSPIAYGYDDQLYLYYNRGPVITVGTPMGGGGGFDGGGLTGRSSGRGSATDPDVIQARPYMAPEKPVKRTPREQELYIPEEIREYVRWSVPPKEAMPRVIVRFAPEKDLVLSGLIQNGSEIAEKPAVVDVPHGKGHVVLFANNPMWRDETRGSYPLVFNAIMNYDKLDTGREEAGKN